MTTGRLGTCTFVATLRVTHAPLVCEGRGRTGDGGDQLEETRMIDSLR